MNLTITSKNYNSLTSSQEIQIAQAYSSAFASEPWFEKTQDSEGNFSSVNINEVCPRTGVIGTMEAYPASETIANFRNKIVNANGLLEVEQNDQGQNLMNYLFLPTDLKDLIMAKYKSNFELQEELQINDTPNEFVWLDEIFASFVREKGNMYQFDEVIKRVLDYYQQPICYRTINQKVIDKTTKSFPNSQILQPVNDNRTFLTIS
jgi:hypothetical protein